MNNRRASVPALATFLTLAAVSAASAHTGHGSPGGFLHGLEHPVGGFDHLLAMLAVGLWAAQTGGRALWLVPLTFVSVMALGGILGMAGIVVPFTEGGILVSVLGLGVLIAAAVRMPIGASMAIVAFFALFHGAAHGAEIPPQTSGLAYALGFMVSTAALHVAGITAGILTQKISAPVLTRCAGALVAGCGVWLWLA